jgi:hypothetical protein
MAIVLAATLLFAITTGCDDCDTNVIATSGGTSTSTQVESALSDDLPDASVERVTDGPGANTGDPFQALASPEGIRVLGTTVPGESDGSSTTVLTDESVTTVAETTTTTAAPTTTTAAPSAPSYADPGAVPANGDTFYVSANSGNDGNDGRSASSPWKSLQAGLKRLTGGQTLLVMDGEYREVKAPGIAHYTVDHGGSAGNWMRVAAAPGHSPTIVASQGSGIQITSSYVEVSGLTIRGSGFGVDNNWGVGISVNNADHVRLVGNRITAMPTSGISVTESSKFDLIGNDISYNSFWSPLQGSGISVWHSKNRGHGAGSDGYHDRIIGNRVYGNENKVNSQFKEFKVKSDGNGIIVDQNIDTGYSGRVLIANNLVYDNGGRGIIAWESNRVDIVFNTGYQNGQTDGISGGATEFAAGKANDVIIANNVGWARSGLPAIIFDRVTSGNSYNNVLITDSPSGHAGSRDIMHSGNPGFRNASTDPGSADFRPSGESVLKGAVRDSPTFVSTDLVGTSRGGGTPDVGAFEAEASSR